MTLFRVLIILLFRAAFHIACLGCFGFIPVFGFGARIYASDYEEERDDNKEGQRCLKNEGDRAVPLGETEHLVSRSGNRAAVARIPLSEHLINFDHNRTKMLRYVFLEVTDHGDVGV